MLPIRLRVIVYTQKEVTGIVPGFFLIEGEAAAHLSCAPRVVRWQAEVSAWHRALVNRKLLLLCFRRH